MNQDSPTDAQVHRFHDDVAVHISDVSGGKTVYFSKEDAARLGLAIRRHAADCKAREYLKSNIPTWHLREDDQ